MALRDQLVYGIKDHATKSLLFRQENLTYDTAFKLATSLEAAEKNASTTDKSVEPSKEVVNKIQSSRPKADHKR